MSTNSRKRFGGASDAVLAQVTKLAASSISVANAGTREAFLDAWVRTLSNHAKHLRANSTTLTAPVVLAYVPDLGEFEKQHDWTRRPMLGTSHLDNFAGMLAVGTGEVCACVHASKFSKTEEFEQEILSADLQSAPTIALMSEAKLIVWPDGIEGGGALSFDSSLDGSAVIIDLETIDGTLNDFYETVARQTKTWWKNAQLRITVERPETTVQYALWLFLNGKFCSVARIKTEEIIGNGRADITIVPINPTAGDQSAVLELKTVRDARTPRTDNVDPPIKISLDENIKWACSGIQQTAAYRDDNHMGGAFLCVYDFCAGNSNNIDDAVNADASKYSVLYRRYWITASHEEHRNDRYPLSE